MHKTLLALAIAAIGAVAVSTQANAALSVPSGGAYSYTQNFDSLATSGTANAWTNDSTLQGWSLFAQPAPGTAITAYNAGDGSSNTGSFYSFGAANGSDRALGGVGSGGAYFGSPASGNIAGWIAVAFQNNTGSTLSNFTVGFDGEQWRNGGNTSAQSMVLEYGFGSSFATVASWSAPGGSFDWASPVATSTAGALDGNAAANRVTGLGGTVTTPWTAGNTLWIRWVERNDTGNDHGLAIDNVSFAVDPVPEPENYALMLAGIGVVGAIARRRMTAV